MTARCFADTNVVVYTLDANSQKRERALAIMRGRPVISVQVVNEFLSAVIGKLKIPRTKANRLGHILMRRCEVVAVTPEIVVKAMALGERYQISHWDALVVSAALATGCDTLYSEDMQDGQLFDGRVTVRNPF